jgi:molybdenum cofactor cytidylyltransferase
MAVTAVVLAAGKGARFAAAAPGAPAKLLTEVSGVPLILRTLSALRAGGVTRLFVVISPDTDVAVSALAADAGATLVVNSHPSRGMLSSIHTGLAAACPGPADVCLVMPGDVPFVMPATVATIVEAALRTGRSVSPRCDGRGGHPVAVSQGLRRAVLSVDAELTSLNVLLAADDPLCLDVTDRGVLRDVDTPADLQSL